MIRVVVLAVLSTLTACQSEKEAKIENLRSDLETVRASLASCDYARTQLQKEEGEVSKAQWDVAAAENMDSIDPDQEADIRASLSDQMGIAPSKVDWKGIYKSRADTAKAKLSGKNYGLESAQEQVKRSCADQEKDQKKSWQLEDAIKRLGGVI